MGAGWVKPVMRLNKAQPAKPISNVQSRKPRPPAQLPPPGAIKPTCNNKASMPMPPRHHSSTQVNKNPMACKLPVMALFCGRHSAKQSRGLPLGATLHGLNAHPNEVGQQAALGRLGFCDWPECGGRDRLFHPSVQRHHIAVDPRRLTHNGQRNQRRQEIN